MRHQFVLVVPCFCESSIYPAAISEFDYFRDCPNREHFERSWPKLGEIEHSLHRSELTFGVECVDKTVRTHVRERNIRCIQI